MLATKRLAYSIAIALVSLLSLVYYNLYFAISALHINRQIKILDRNNLSQIIIIDARGNFSQRIEEFNKQLNIIRRQVLELRGSNRRKDFVYNKPVQVLSGTRDDYLNVLAKKYPHVITVTLPWISTGEGIWNSLADTVNLPLQTYYQWTADNRLCTWIEKRGLLKPSYNVLFNRTCVRDMNKTVSPQSLPPIILNFKPLIRHSYWPNHGNAYPAHFYRRPPPFVTNLHIHRDAIVTAKGDVYSSNLKLVLSACSKDLHPYVPKVSQVYDEVFVITQFWGKSVFHRMCEVMPRIAFYRKFLDEHPNICIVAPERPGRRLSQLLRIIGISGSRLVVGLVRAKIVYQPRSTQCGTANVQESQTLSQLYRNYITKYLPPKVRNTLIVIRRTRKRIFREQKLIEKLLKRVAADYNLSYKVFADNPTPSLKDTMMMFHSAVMIVGPHGAGLSNMLFSQPGTYVIEGMCNLPHVNVCFQRLAYILGHHWHGVTSRRGCERIVDVPADNVENAARILLRMWKLTGDSKFK